VGGALDQGGLEVSAVTVRGAWSVKAGCKL
jgi:hypothetical protein